jgi:hypothetical protein
VRLQHPGDAGCDHQRSERQAGNEGQHETMANAIAHEKIDSFRSASAQKADATQRPASPGRHATTGGAHAAGFVQVSSKARGFAFARSLMPVASTRTPPATATPAANVGVAGA